MTRALEAFYASRLDFTRALSPREGLTRCLGSSTALLCVQAAPECSAQSRRGFGLSRLCRATQTRAEARLRYSRDVLAVTVEEAKARKAQQERDRRASWRIRRDEARAERRRIAGVAS